MFKNKGFIEFIKYASIGALNVLIDFLVLNLLWFFTGMYSGTINYLFKLISFSIYSINGYFLNKKLIFYLISHFEYFAKQKRTDR